MDHISKSLLPELLLLTSFILYQDICKQHGEDSQAYELILIPRTKELKKISTGDSATFVGCWQTLTFS